MLLCEECKPSVLSTERMKEQRSLEWSGKTPGKRRGFDGWAEFIREKDGRRPSTEVEEIG